MRAALLLSYAHFLFLHPLSLYISHIQAVVATATYPYTPSASATPLPRIHQPILQPNSSTVLTPGTTFLITWTPDTRFQNVTLELWDRTSWGYSRDFGTFCYHYLNPFCGSIGLHVPNTGNFSWPIPIPQNGFPRNDRSFWIKMYVNDFLKPEIGTVDPVVTFSESFAFGSTDGTGWISSTPPIWAMMQTGTSPGDSSSTVLVTAQDQTVATSSVIALTASSVASATTGFAKKSGLENTSQGVFSRKGRPWVSGMGILLGFL